MNRTKIKAFALVFLLVTLSYPYLPGESGFVSQDNEQGIWGNPASVNAFDSKGALLGYDYDNGITNMRIGGNLNYFAAGFEYRFNDDKLDESRWSLSHSIPMFSRAFFLGERFTAFRSSEFSGTEWSYGIGAMLRPTNFLSVGYSCDNLLFIGPESQKRLQNVGATFRLNHLFSVSYDVEDFEEHRLLFELETYGFRVGFKIPIYGDDDQWRLTFSTSLGGYGDFALHVFDDGIPKGGVLSYHAARNPRASMMGKIIRIPLDKEVSEISNSIPFFGNTSINIWDLRNLFEHLYQESFGLVILDFSGYSGNLGVSLEIDRAVEKLKAKGGLVVAYMDDIRPSTLMAAAHADRIVAEPSAHLNWRGLGGSILYYKGLFDKLGVKVEFLRHGKFKSAVEPYTADSMSVEARENMETLYKEMWSILSKNLSKRFKDSEEENLKLLDSLAAHPVITAKAAKNFHIVDTLLYIDQVPAYALKTFFDYDVPYAYSATWRPTSKKIFNESWKRRKIIAVLNIDGTIDSRMERKVKEYLRVLPATNAQALIVRISSPGGSALASDKIWGALQYVKELGIPVVASIGNMGASGGYYIACGANVIVAEPSAIVGSIGIYGGKIDASGLLSKIGVRSESVKTHEYSDAQTFGRPWTEVEKEALQEYMDDFYDRFTGVVSKATNIPQVMVDTSYGGGRVMTGEKAFEAGLVHQLGGIDTAIEVAKKLAGISSSVDVEIKQLNAGKNFIIPTSSKNSVLDYGIDLLKELEQTEFWAIEPMLWGIE